MQALLGHAGNFGSPMPLSRKSSSASDTDTQPQRRPAAARRGGTDDRVLWRGRHWAGDRGASRASPPRHAPHAGSARCRRQRSHRLATAASVGHCCAAALQEYSGSKTPISTPAGGVMSPSVSSHMVGAHSAPPVSQRRCAHCGAAAQPAPASSRDSTAGVLRSTAVCACSS